MILGKTKYSEQFALDSFNSGLLGVCGVPSVVCGVLLLLTGLWYFRSLLETYYIGNFWLGQAIVAPFQFLLSLLGFTAALLPAVRYCMWRRDYFRWCAVVNEAKIRWVKVEALRRWHRNGQHIPRMQDLARGDYVDIAHGTCQKDRNRFVISHAWLSAGEPDPTREQLKALVAELDRVGALDTDVAFYDHTSIPQVPRTEEETQHFTIALQNMNLLYTLEGTRVLVIPEVSNSASNPTPYPDRGWCFFEIAVSSACSTIFNYESFPVVELLEHYKFPLSSQAFRTAFADTKFTVKGDRRQVEILYDGFLAQAERKRSAEKLL